MTISLKINKKKSVTPNGGDFDYMSADPIKQNNKESPKKYLVKTRIANSSLVELVSKEDGYKKRELTKSVIANERSHNLYIKAIQKIENRKKSVKEKEKNDHSRELEKCTFKPKINNNYKKSRNISMDMERTKRESLKSTYEPKAKEDEKTNCTFKPRISQLDVNKTFKTKVKYDKSSQKYFQRIKKAQNLENEKKQKLNPDYNLMYEKLYKNKGNMRMNTMTLTYDTKDDYCTFNPNQTVTNFGSAKRTLHDQLHSIQLDTDFISNDRNNSKLNSIDV